ncbi:7112_t:CDS:2 [Ambispora leptoticha]|uniref:7112_t:CDS:1 n=1 Tax=Ambispora leptoticha TaxID=144679 RepID=A0A9N9GFH4_9GLOM|nr:7112_t:CDS:2 [Ambispora leptoticha]
MILLVLARVMTGVKVLNHSSKGCASTPSKQLANMTDLSAFPQQLCEYFGGNSKGAMWYSFPQEKCDKLPAVFGGILMLESMNADQKTEEQCYAMYIQCLGIAIDLLEKHVTEFSTSIPVILVFYGRLQLKNSYRRVRKTLSNVCEKVHVEGVFSRRAIIRNLIKVDNPLSDGSFQVEMKLPESIDVESSILVEVEAGVIMVTVKKKGVKGRKLLEIL